MKLLSVLLIFLAHLSFAQTAPAPQPAPPTQAAYDSTQVQNQLNQPFHEAPSQSPDYKAAAGQLAATRKVRATTLILPAALVGYGALTLESPQLAKGNYLVRETILNHYPDFRTRLDNYTRYVPLAAVYGLNLSGIKGQHNLVDLSMIYLMSSVMSRTMTRHLKQLTHSERPDQSTYDSFPSQHTASAFAKAELLRQEFRGRSPWYGVAGYSFAFATGSLRMLNNKHWLSDVLAGAGVGILSTRVAYLVYPWMQRHIARGLFQNVALAPVYQQGNVGLALSFRPGTGNLIQKK